MSYKAILVHVDASPQSAARIAAAAEIAKTFGATLIGLAAGQVRPVVDPYGAVVWEIEVERQEIAEGLKAAEALFRAAVDAALVSSEWIAQVAYPSLAIVGEASAADLIVLGRTRTDVAEDAFKSVDIGDVVMSSGRPVLVLPANASSPKLDTVMIAWKDTREARRAVSDALPFLKLAKRRIVAEIARDALDYRAKSGIERVCAFLKRHGLDPEMNLIAPSASPTEDQLLDVAASAHADLIIAGGYGHTRLREWIFGGVTRALIRRSPVPVLLSH
jgi:nucleotide-binding universal stress UspA family protein